MASLSCAAIFAVLLVSQAERSLARVLRQVSGSPREGRASMTAEKQGVATRCYWRAASAGLQQPTSSGQIALNGSPKASHGRSSAEGTAAPLGAVVAAPSAGDPPGADGRLPFCRHLCGHLPRRSLTLAALACIMPGIRGTSSGKPGGRGDEKVEERDCGF
jgi:hypothetical protein